MTQSNLTKINYISNRPIKFGNVTSAIDDNFTGIESLVQDLKDHLPTKISDFSDANLWATKEYSSDLIDRKLKQGSYITNFDLTAVQQSLISSINFQKVEITRIATDLDQTKNTIQNLNVKFDPGLDDTVQVVHGVGGIKSTHKVQDLKNKTLNEILTLMLFEETWPPTPELGARITTPSNESIWFTNEAFPKRAEDVAITYNPAFNGNVSYTVTLPTGISSLVPRLEPYEYIVKVVQEKTTVTITSSRKNTKTETVPKKQVTLTSKIYITNPIYIYDKSVTLTKKLRFGTTQTYTFDLQSSSEKPIKIYIPWSNSASVLIKKFNMGLYQDANMEVWEFKEINNPVGCVSGTYKTWEYKGTDTSAAKYQITVTL